ARRIRLLHHRRCAGLCLLARLDRAASFFRFQRSWHQRARMFPEISPSLLALADRFRPGQEELATIEQEASESFSSVSPSWSRFWMSEPRDEQPSRLRSCCRSNGSKTKTQITENWLQEGFGHGGGTHRRTIPRGCRFWAAPSDRVLKARTV